MVNLFGRLPFLLSKKAGQHETHKYLLARVSLILIMAITVVVTNIFSLVSSVYLSLYSKVLLIVTG